MEEEGESGREMCLNSRWMLQVKKERSHHLGNYLSVVCFLGTMQHSGTNTWLASS